ncbi:4-hydroxyphenylacetate catabolism regulatory protein HpaA [Leeia oryzae]|uniref:4-hydroxyphenylacetate catabolism regulatory protein HpaA n=1 Tax=Leeia oryzae TaxID=356662 RepID=UPI00037D32FD|nr:4-hydroxyphenylacetate catabolism regulatory protein HpaA [Leeia oryzae]
MSNPTIPNIDIGKVYDHQYDGAEVHYESFGRMADFFGRTTAAHHHDRFYQIHFLDSGYIQLQLDQQFYLARAPLVFFTPPAIPHAFSTEPVAEGHVLTIRQDIIWDMHTGIANAFPAVYLQQPFCLEAAHLSVSGLKAFDDIRALVNVLKTEFQSQHTGRSFALRQLTQYIVLALWRLAPNSSVAQQTGRDDTRLFLQFTKLVDAHYTEHWPLKNYADQLCITEARLNEVARRVANLSSKQLVFERLMLEAKRQLLFASSSVAQVAYRLGFKDPAYFSRFFTRQASMTPLQYKQVSAEKMSRLAIAQDPPA